MIVTPKEAMNLRILMMLFTRNLPTSTGFFLEMSQTANDKKSLLDGSELIGSIVIFEAEDENLRMHFVLPSSVFRSSLDGLPIINKNIK